MKAGAAPRQARPTAGSPKTGSLAQRRSSRSAPPSPGREAPKPARPAAPIAGSRVQPGRAGKNTTVNRWADKSDDLSECEGGQDSNRSAKQARPPDARSGRAGGKAGGSVAVTPVPVAGPLALTTEPDAPVSAPAETGLLASASAAEAAEADNNTFAALEEGELRTAVLLTPAPQGSHAAEASDAAADMRHAKIPSEADTEAVVRRVLRSRDQQLEQKLSEVEQQLTNVQAQLTAALKRVQQLEQAQSTAATSGPSQAAMLAVEAGLRQTQLRSEEQQTQLERVIQEHDAAKAAEPADKGVPANEDVVMAHGMTCEGNDAQGFSTEDVGMLQTRVADMLKDGLHLEGVEVLKVERIKLRNLTGKIPPVRIRVARKDQCISVLRAASQLKDHPAFNKIYLQPDLTPAQQLRKRLAMGRFRDLRKQNITCCFRLDRIWTRTEGGQWLPDRSC